MELLKNILAKGIEEDKMIIAFSKIGIELKEIIESECYKLLKKIKNVIEDNSLSDEECFMKFEKIICIFESIGSNGGDRHDF